MWARLQVTRSVDVHQVRGEEGDCRRLLREPRSQRAADTRDISARRGGEKSVRCTFYREGESGRAAYIRKSICAPDCCGHGRSKVEASTQRIDGYICERSSTIGCRPAIAKAGWAIDILMEILRLVPYDCSVLREEASHVDFPLSAADATLIDRMMYSIQESNLAKANAPFPSASGMAAPQWGHSRKIFIIRQQYLGECSECDRGAFVAVINPQYEGIGEYGECEDWEGCFSVPGCRGRVRRHRRIHASFQRHDGERCEMELEGWAARVFQHECDHTEGRLYDDPGAGKCLEKQQKALVVGSDGQAEWRDDT